MEKNPLVGNKRALAARRKIAVIQQNKAAKRGDNSKPILAEIKYMVMILAENPNHPSQPRLMIGFIGHQSPRCRLFRDGTEKKIDCGDGVIKKFPKFFQGAKMMPHLFNNKKEANLAIKKSKSDFPSQECVYEIVPVEINAPENENAFWL